MSDIIQELIGYITGVYDRVDAACIESGGEPTPKRGRYDVYCMSTDLGYGSDTEIVATPGRASADMNGIQVVELRSDGVMMIDISQFRDHNTFLAVRALNNFFGACGLAIHAQSHASRKVYVWLVDQAGGDDGGIDTIHQFMYLRADEDKVFADDLRQLEMINSRVYLGIKNGVKGVFLPPHNYKAARDAAMEWLLSARVLGVDRHVSRLIAELVWWSRLDYGVWLNRRVTGAEGVHKWQRTYLAPFCEKVGITRVPWRGTCREGDDQLE